MWDIISSIPASVEHPAVTVYTVASGDERHTTRHTRSLTGGVKTTRLGAVQRRVLMTVLKLALDTVSGTRRSEEDIWVPWRPEAFMSTERTSAERVAVSKALATLHKRRLLMVRRHEGGRAQAVRLTAPGRDIAWELYSHGGRTLEQEQVRLANLLRAEVRRAVYRGLPRTPVVRPQRGAPREARAIRQALLEVDRGDPDAEPGTLAAPGFGATPDA